MNKYKARLVAKGYAQKEGIDYNEIFSPVVMHTSIRILLAIVAQFDIELEQMDVKIAFLHSEGCFKMLRGVSKSTLNISQWSGHPKKSIQSCHFNQPKSTKSESIKVEKLGYYLKIVQPNRLWKKVEKNPLRPTPYTQEPH